MKVFHQPVMSFMPIQQFTLRHFFQFAGILFFFLYGGIGWAQEVPEGSMYVGIARVDITPSGPIRMAGYANASRSTESEGVIHNLWAKALAFGTDSQNPSILITVDLVGISGDVTKNLANDLSEKFGMDPAQLVILASHTHGGPEVGNLLNILHYNGKDFSEANLPLGHLINIAEYRVQLSQKLEEVAVAAMEDRSQALVSWGQGQALFGKNRRAQGGPVDPSLPMLRVTDLKGNLRAVLVNYACHGTTLPGDLNKIHGDWMSEAQLLIEANHPGAIAMVSIGAGADCNPDPRGTIENMKMHGKEISDNVNKLLTAQLQPLVTPPAGRMEWVELPFANSPTISELIEHTKENSIKGHYARLALERVLRGKEVPKTLSYPVQTWTFGNELAMVNLAGEVVVDYAVRLKNSLGADNVWMNAYANDVPSYIASVRVIGEGGYEAEGSMYWYDKPSPFKEEVEDIVINAVFDQLPDSYKVERDTINHPQLVTSGNDGSLILSAEVARSKGPTIGYMPEWKAFGWFKENDIVEWDIKVDKKGLYDVYLEWSVSDAEAGKPFILETKGEKLNGKIEKTGSWFTFRKEKIGQIRLKSGRQKITFRPDPNAEKGALMDLREVQLVPVN